MKRAIGLLQVTLIVLALISNSLADHRLSSFYPGFFVNVIEGQVLDPLHRPVPDLWVELQNSFNSTVARARTSGNGRFSFSNNIRAGQYYIKVYTTGTPFQDQTVSVEVVSVIQNASDTVYVDITLRYTREANQNAASQSKASETIFAQEVPEEAKRLYKSGAKNLENGDLRHGTEDLIAALRLFPDYYDALDALGCSYVSTKEYQKALPYLIRAIDLNQRSYTSYYALGYAAFKLDHLPEAGEAARAATVLRSDSINAHLLYGTVLRMSGNYEKAASVLQRAEKLSKTSPVAEVHWQLALLYNKLKRNSEAADQLERYLKIDPSAPNRKEIVDLIQKLRAKTS